MNEQEQALAEIKALIQVPGALRVVTHIPNCAWVLYRAGLMDIPALRSSHETSTGKMKQVAGGLSADDRASFDAALDGWRPDKFENPHQDPRWFVCNPVISVTEMDERGRVEVATAEGDLCIGVPTAVLSKCREHSA
jgi:hypothetical protein